MENPDRWKKIKLAIDRATFVDQLNRVRDSRNDVMHFDPDGLDDDDLTFLRDFSRFLKIPVILGLPESNGLSD